MTEVHDKTTIESIARRTEQHPDSDLVISAPRDVDAAEIHDLIASCPPLDGNSLYANLLQCTHFAQTCALARRGDEIVAWVSGYIPPEEPHTWFLWQVAVREDARGLGLPRRLVEAILSRAACRDVHTLKTTITPGNEASWALFRSIARRLGAPLEERVLFERDAHFRGRHDSEHLVSIGPFPGRPGPQARRDRPD